MVSGEKSGLNTFLDETGVTVDLITKYGTHNFNLTRTILDSLEEKIKPFHGEARSQQIEEFKND